MFKLTLTLVILAAFEGTFSTPVPQNVNGLTGALTGLTETLPELPVDPSTVRRQAEGLPGLDILSNVPIVGNLLGGATGGSGLLKRQLDLGTIVHDVLVDVPGVVSTVGGAVERPIAGVLLQKRQLGGVDPSSLLGNAAGAVIGAATSHLPRQEDFGEGEDEIRKRQDATGILSDLTSVAGGGLLGNLPVELPGSGLPRRQVDALAGIANSIQNGIPVAGPLVGGAADGSLPSGVLNERQIGSLLGALGEEEV